MKQLGLILAALALASVGNARAQQPTILAGEPRITPTIHCLGLYLPVVEDREGKTTAQVEYREKGNADWKQAFPLWRVVSQTVDVEKNEVGGFPVWFAGSLAKWGGMKSYAIAAWSKNYLAGSIFNLKPDTAYEIRVQVKEPSGKETVLTLQATTRAVPAIPKDGNRIEVSGGGSALGDAIKTAKPGDIFVVRGGTYAPFTVFASGTAQSPIVIHAADNEDVVIEGGGKTGININGSHVHVEELTIKNFATAGIKVSSTTTNVAVTRCKLSGCWTAIRAFGRNGYYADNTIVGIKEPAKQGDHTEGHGIEIFHGQGGTGTVICHNTVSHVADAFRIQCADADLYENDAFFCSDDAVETDFGGANLRIWGNRFSYTGHNGISFQPYIGGPAYVIRNVVFNPMEYTIKDRYKSSGVILINNTFIAVGDHDDACTPIPEHVFARNNLFVTTRRDALRFHPEDLMRNPITLDLDHNGYIGAITGTQWSFFKRPDLKAMTLANFQTLSGLEKNGMELKADTCFKNPLPALEEIKQSLASWSGQPHPDVSLKEGSPAIDKGVVIPNLADDLVGKAPDLGAWEVGGKLPQWGVRPR